MIFTIFIDSFFFDLISLYLEEKKTLYVVKRDINLHHCFSFFPDIN